LAALFSCLSAFFALCLLQAVAENQPPKNRMQLASSISQFETRLREFFHSSVSNTRYSDWETRFQKLALDLFQLQFASNEAYRDLCSARGVNPALVTDWKQIPAAPASAFKELELSCLPAVERTRVFYSSGTTRERPSRHFHNDRSLALYENSAASWFGKTFGLFNAANAEVPTSPFTMIFLTPQPGAVPNSSLAHMFATLNQKWGGGRSHFIGEVSPRGVWTIDFKAATKALEAECAAGRPLFLIGTAFSFVHLLDFFAESDLRFQLPAGSRVMETGGYKGQSRVVPRSELHLLIGERLGVPPSQIVCEYGMCELSSQAYAMALTDADTRSSGRIFDFPPWAKTMIISPETGTEVSEGETGLIRVFDLANVCSVMAVQTEDLGIRHGDGFELVGRAENSEARGCSLMASSLREAL